MDTKTNPSTLSCKVTSVESWCNLTAFKLTTVRVTQTPLQQNQRLMYKTWIRRKLCIHKQGTSSSSTRSRPHLELIQHPTEWELGSLSGCEIKHSPSSRAEVQNECDYISSPPVSFHDVVRENFAFNFTFVCIASTRSFNKGLTLWRRNYFLNFSTPCI